MNIEIKNVKHSEFASQETHCFQATIYLDGKRFAQVENDGHGGCDNVYPIPGAKLKGKEWRDKLDAVEAELGKEIIPFDGDTYVNDAGIERSSTFTLTNSLELVVGNLVNKWLQDKEIKTILRRISYIKEGGLYQQPARVKPTPMNLINIKNAPWWKKDNILLTGLSVQDARAQLATINFFGEL